MEKTLLEVPRLNEEYLKLDQQVAKTERTIGEDDSLNELENYSADLCTEINEEKKKMDLASGICKALIASH